MVQLTLEELQLLAQNLEIDNYLEMDQNQLLNALTSDWIIYTKEGCSYCTKAKDLLKSKGINFSTIVINDLNRNTILEKIDPLTNSYKYYPKIFNGKQFIGGYTELKNIFTENNNFCTLQ